MTLALAAAVPLAGVVVGGSVARAGPVTVHGTRGPEDCRQMWTRDPGHQIEIVTTYVGQTARSDQWMDVECGSVTVQVPRGQQPMVTVSVQAEGNCRGEKGYCEGRVMADGNELHPSIAGNPTDSAWETAKIADYGNGREISLIRVGQLSCPADNAAPVCDKKIQLQIRTSAEWFGYDDSIVRAEIWTTPPTGPTGPTAPAVTAAVLPVAGQKGYLRPATNDSLALDVFKGGLDNRAPVQLHGYHGGENQKWEAVPAGAGGFLLKGPMSGKCVDLAGRQDKSPLQLWSCDGDKYPEQVWQFRDLGDGSFDIFNAHANACVGQGGIKADERPVMVPCDSGAAQKWKWSR